MQKVWGIDSSSALQKHHLQALFSQIDCRWVESNRQIWTLLTAFHRCGFFLAPRQNVGSCNYIQVWYRKNPCNKKLYSNRQSESYILWCFSVSFLNSFNYFNLLKQVENETNKSTLRVRTVAKRHVRSSTFTASFILVLCFKLRDFWNNERWKSCIKSFSIMKLFHFQKPLSKWR